MDFPTNGSIKRTFPARLTALFLLCFLAVFGWNSRDAWACPTPCTVAGGTYQVLEPDGWDGTSPLPVVVWFHGYGRTGKYVVNSPRIGGETRKNGVLLVALDGMNKSWSVRNAPESYRDEVAFVKEVLADVRSQWPVDETHVWAGGFSLGSSMVWDIACTDGGLFSAYFTVSGGFWRPHPEHCATGPDRMRYVHGTTDTVMPLNGRQIGEHWHQGRTFESFSVLRRANRCGTEPTRMVTEADRRCWIWTGCAAATEMEFCLHDGGHKIPSDWVATSIAWANRLPRG